MKKQKRLSDSMTQNTTETFKETFEEEDFVLQAIQTGLKQHCQQLKKQQKSKRRKKTVNQEEIYRLNAQTTKKRLQAKKKTQASQKTIESKK